jgi:hypothetical protein
MSVLLVTIDDKRASGLSSSDAGRPAEQYSRAMMLRAAGRHLQRTTYP